MQLGRGDFSTSIPVSGTPEVAALARTMEDMRRNLIDLTATLRRREAEAQALLQGVVEGVFAVDAQRNVRYLNPQAARMLGVEPAAADRPLLRRRAAALRRGRPAALRDGLPDPRRAAGGQGAGDRDPRDRPADRSGRS